MTGDVPGKRDPWQIGAMLQVNYEEIEASVVCHVLGNLEQATVGQFRDAVGALTHKERSSSMAGRHAGRPLVRLRPGRISSATPASFAPLA